MRLLKRLSIFLALAAVLTLGVLFAVQNTATAALDLLWIQLPEQRVALWLVLAFAVGGAVGMLISAIALVRLKARVLLLQRKLASQETAYNRADLLASGKNAVASQSVVSKAVVSKA